LIFLRAAQLSLADEAIYQQRSEDDPEAEIVRKSAGPSGDKMIEAVLIINLEPPFMGCSPGKDEHPKTMQWHNCTQEEIRSLLVELKVISLEQKWPPRDCVIRLRGTYPTSVLAKFGLVDGPSLTSLPH